MTVVMRHKKWVVLLLVILGVWLRQAQLSRIDMRLRQVEEHRVRVRVKVERDHRMFVSQVYLDETWVSIGAHHVRVKRSGICRIPPTEKGLAEYLGEFKLHKSLYGWNRDFYDAFRDRPVLLFTCKVRVYGFEPPLTLASRIKKGWTVGLYWFEALRARVCETLKSKIPAGWGGDILYALLSGDKSRISISLRVYLQQSFVWHLCVISGMHVVFVFGGLMWVWKWISFPLRESRPVVALSVDSWVRVLIGVFFVGWWGANPSALRGLGFYAAYRWSHHQKYMSVVWALAGLLFLFPSLMQSVGFWMSVYASICFGLSMRLVGCENTLLKNSVVMWIMNLCMTPWVIGLNGYIVWPWLLLSPLMLLTLFIMIGSSIAGMVFSPLLCVGKSSETMMISLFEFLSRYHSAGAVRLEITSECVWGLSIGCVLLLGCLSFFRLKTAPDLS